MAITTLKKRESALIDENPAIIPHAAISETDRYTLLGQYSGVLAAVYPDIEFLFDLYVEATKSLDAMHVSRSQLKNMYVSRTRSAVNLEI